MIKDPQKMSKREMRVELKTHRKQEAGKISDSNAPGYDPYNSIDDFGWRQRLGRTVAP